jgi:hypothetical protein
MVLRVIPAKGGLAARTSARKDAEPTHEELNERLGLVAMVAKAKGGGATGWRRHHGINAWVTHR